MLEIPDGIILKNTNGCMEFNIVFGFRFNEKVLNSKQLASGSTFGNRISSVDKVWLYYSISSGNRYRIVT
jgi:hypothetical protein